MLSRRYRRFQWNIVTLFVVTVICTCSGIASDGSLSWSTHGTVPIGMPNVGGVRFQIWTRHQLSYDIRLRRSNNERCESGRMFRWKTPTNHHIFTLTMPFLMFDVIIYRIYISNHSHTKQDVENQIDGIEYRLETIQGCSAVSQS